jgi:hypothetical protein
VVQVAVVPVSGCAPQEASVDPLSMNLTEALGLAPATVAVKVTGCPAADGFRDELTAVAVLASQELSNPVDPNSDATGDTIFVLSEVYESPAGVVGHWKQAVESWQDPPRLHGLELQGQGCHAAQRNGRPDPLVDAQLTLAQTPPAHLRERLRLLSQPCGMLFQHAGDVVGRNGG